MQIKVTGGNKKLRAELDKAAQFFGKILLHGKTYKDIVLDIDIHKKYDIYGDCMDDDGGRRPRFFTINLKQNDPDDRDYDPVKTLAHEMVHLKQFATGELRGGFMVPARGNSRMLTSKWHGKLWIPGTKDDKYFDSPWEIEAYGREVGLYYRWIDHIEGRT